MRLVALGGAFTVLGFGASGLSAVRQADPTPTRDQTAFFETQVRPVLATNCTKCHGPTVQMGGLRLDSRAAMLKGGDGGPVVVPGDPAKSRLVQAIHQTGALKMPPSGKLSLAQISAIEEWIRQGALWPAKSVVALAEKPLWSLQPVKLPPVPPVRNVAWVRHPIDAFVLAKLEATGLTPAPEADRRTLIRRVTFDLTGLPPTAAQIEEFLHDASPNAYERVVDRLLASPQYGERWARLWLDVARYADTKGYVFNEDRAYPNAYTYRSWVIQAFNRDLPYDRFILQQLAADRLPETKGEDRTALAAMGYLTLGRRFLNSVPDIIDDRIDVTMRGLQGFTVACARCHDHKFDPIPTQDYYSLYAIFNSSREDTLPISPPAIRDPWLQHRAQIDAAENEQNGLIQAQVRRLRGLIANPSTTGSVSAEVRETLQGLREEQMPDGGQLVKLATAFEPAQQAKLADLQSTLTRLRQTMPETPEFAMAMVEGPNPSDGVVFRRGNPGMPGDRAPRRFLRALSKPGAERPVWNSGSGRLELAQAIASRNNPLTARVFVNRVWMHHFGEGLVRTASDFGHQGERPSHPELLDYLAAKFMQTGWSVKRLHRMIVLSATYRQASTMTADKRRLDPDNRLLSRMRRHRLDLEQMRDSLLFAAGRLDLAEVGGKSFDLWSAPYVARRSVYGYVERQNLPGIFRTFDFASPDSTSARRFSTTVPQQALFFMNSGFVRNMSEQLAMLPEIAKSANDGQRVRRLYRRLFGRLPDAKELAIGTDYLRLGAPKGVPAVWSYGYGGVAVDGKVTFTPLKEYRDASYRVGPTFPDPQLGYILLNAQGGHPGNDAEHAVIRRWVAPADMTIEVVGTLGHGQQAGDGVRARVISSRHGIVGEWQAHTSQTLTSVKAWNVVRGEVVDFVVDPLGGPNSDAYSWAPIIRTTDGRQAWDAQTGFGPPSEAPPTRVAMYAQALLMTNEFLFVD